MKTTCYVQSNIGTARAGNEDNYFCCGSWRERTDAPLDELLRSAEGETLLFAVFDGMGGEAAGERASLLCAETLRQESLAGGTFEAPAFYHRANAAVTSLGQSLGSTSGSTAAVANLRANRLFVSNVGDSRVYHLRGNALRCLTYDHTHYQALIDSGYTVVDESERHVLTQFLGMGTQRPMSPHFAVSVPLEAGDRVLLCSDGLSGALDDAAILSHLQTPAGPEQAGRALVQAALAAGSLDNVTVMVLDVTALSEGADPLAETASEGPVTRRFDVPAPEQIARQERELRRAEQSELRRSVWLLVLAALGVLALLIGILYLALHHAPGGTLSAAQTLAVDAAGDQWYNFDNEQLPGSPALRWIGGASHD